MQKCDVEEETLGTYFKSMAMHIDAIGKRTILKNNERDIINLKQTIQRETLNRISNADRYNINTKYLQ